MALSDTAARVAPIARMVLQDDDVRSQVRRAAQAGRAAATRPAPRPTRLRRAGVALRETGAVLSAFGARAEARRRAERRAAAVKATFVGGAVAAAVAAGAVLYGKSTSKEAEAARV